MRKYIYRSSADAATSEQSERYEKKVLTQYTLTIAVISRIYGDSVEITRF